MKKYLSLTLILVTLVLLIKAARYYQGLQFDYSPTYSVFPMMVLLVFSAILLGLILRSLYRLCRGQPEWRSLALGLITAALAIASGSLPVASQFAGMEQAMHRHFSQYPLPAELDPKLHSLEPEALAQQFPQLFSLGRFQPRLDAQPEYLDFRYGSPATGYWGYLLSLNAASQCPLPAQQVVRCQSMASQTSAPLWLYVLAWQSPEPQP